MRSVANSPFRMSLPRLALVALLAALASGCGKPPPLPPLGSDAVVLAFGDSLTYGTGANEAESYPAQLAAIIGRRVERSGVPGEVTAQALVRLPGALDEHSPRLLLLMIGGNDFLRRLDKKQAEANVRAMVKLAKGRGVEVLLIGTPEPGFTVSPPGFYANIAKEFRIPYEEDVIGQVLKNSELKSDQIHPNARGYRVIAERLAELLRKSGAI
jgi:lysophospholipase L1-like esterase